MSQLFDSLLATPGCEPVAAATVQAFTGRSGPAVLFLTGDTTQRPEGNDVAVVVREFLRGPQGAGLRLGLVERRDEAEVMKQFGVLVLPALVLLRDGQVLEIVARMRDWSVYAQAFSRLVEAGTEAAPA